MQLNLFFVPPFGLIFIPIWFWCKLLVLSSFGFWQPFQGNEFKKGEENWVTETCSIQQIESLNKSDLVQSIIKNIIFLMEP